MRALVAGLLLVGSPLVAQTLTPEQTRRIDSVFARLDGTDRPGCSVGVGRRGHPVYLKGYGMSDLQQGTPITTESIFHVASVSKQFTTAAILLLAADGNKNGVVDAGDYTVWRDNLGALPAAASGSAASSSPSAAATKIQEVAIADWTMLAGTRNSVSRHVRSRNDRADGVRLIDRQMALLAAVDALHSHWSHRNAESLHIETAPTTSAALTSGLPENEFAAVTDAVFAALGAA